MHVLAVLIVVTTTGLSDADTRALTEHLHADVRAQGGEIAKGGIDTACVESSQCLVGALELAEAQGLVALDVVRAGSFVQLELRTYDAQGTMLARAERSMKMDALAGERLLPDGALPKPKPPAPPPPAPANAAAAAEPASPAPLAQERAPAGEAEASAAVPVAGTATIAVGAVVALGALAFAGYEWSVIRSPSSLGPEKERGALLVPVAGAVAVVGLALVGIGATLVALE